MQVNIAKLTEVVEAALNKAVGHPRWQAAILKAHTQLIENPYISEIDDHSALILGTRGDIYVSNGSCQCEAFKHGQPCWHRAAVQLIKRYREASASHPLADVLVKTGGNVTRIDGWDL